MLAYRRSLLFEVAYELGAQVFGAFFVAHVGAVQISLNMHDESHAESAVVAALVDVNIIQQAIIPLP